MAEENLEGETRMREETEARLGVAMEKAVEEALRRADKGERSEVQQLATERRIEALERMEAERLEDELRKEAEVWQEDELRLPKVETTEEGEG